MVKRSRRDDLHNTKIQIKLFTTIAVTTAALILSMGVDVPANAKNQVPSKEQIEFNKKWWKAVNEYNASDRIEFKSEMSLHYINALREYEKFVKENN